MADSSAPVDQKAPDSPISTSAMLRLQKHTAALAGFRGLNVDPHAYEANTVELPPQALYEAWTDDWQDFEDTLQQ